MNAATYVSVTTLLGDLDACGTTAIVFLNDLSAILTTVEQPAQNNVAQATVASAVAAAVDTVSAHEASLTSGLAGVVIAIQSYVNKTFGSVDNLLFGTGLLVTSSYATLSGDCGFIINPDYVGS